MKIWLFWISDCMFCYYSKYLLLTVFECCYWMLLNAEFCASCVCVCVCERERETGSHHSTSAILIVACVCVCERERERVTSQRSVQPVRNHLNDDPALGWSAAGGACGLAATAPWGAYTVAVGGPAFGLSSALFWVEAAVVPAVVLLGVPCPGGLWMFGARVFSVPASCLAGWGCCSPHTLLNIYMEEPYEHKRAHTHKCTLKHSHWYKNRCSQTHIVLICCCFKTYFVILVMCAAQ